MKRLLFALLSLAFTLPVIAQDDIVGPDDYPENINPLTGLEVDNPDVLNRRPLIIKVSNFPDFVRERQHGLMDADVVWEHLLAGGVTRFSAVFYSNEVERVGPIRSARLVDFELLRFYNALFSYSGMAQGTIDAMNGDPLVRSRVVGGSGPEPALYRVPEDGIALEHTLFGNTAEIRNLAVEYERDTEPEAFGGMAFSTETPTNAVPLDSFIVRYRNVIVEWVWDAEAERWMRFTDDEPHILADTGEQLNATNVVIVEEEHPIQPVVSDNYWGPPNFAFSVNFVGEGRIFMLRDGTVIEGVWRRETRDDDLTYYDLDGEILPFNPGNTFFNLVPMWIDGYEVEVQITDAPIVTVDVGEGVGTNMRFGPGSAYISPDVAYTGDEFALLGRNWN
ncbi:MAG: DUF3048 domain-containing protein, partial [Chloroflexota bacterium]